MAAASSSLTGASSGWALGVLAGSEATASLSAASVKETGPAVRCSGTTFSSVRVGSVPSADGVMTVLYRAAGPMVGADVTVLARSVRVAWTPSRSARSCSSSWAVVSC
ncbi:hypothetical protein OG599_02915 [Streptomyces sp. NBC_01335]|uniref:hypothetical protein n=1 Tax=Streptomyces sp. NBC_01335 TaxID=2903828 RepID=UPI002E0F9A5A|nr:hypothetical protein OG599_02915 [Streptomyces sp. NBC_01335]